MMYVLVGFSCFVAGFVAGIWRHLADMRQVNDDLDALIEMARGGGSGCEGGG